MSARVCGGTGDFGRGERVKLAAVEAGGRGLECMRACVRACFLFSFCLFVC